jgi:ankyrin repeat protein
MLSSGANPNQRPEAAESGSNVETDWATSGPVTPQFDWDCEQWYPLQHAALLPKPDEDVREEHAHMMTALLSQGDDPFAVLRQRLRSNASRSVYPGEDLPKKESPPVDLDNFDLASWEPEEDDDGTDKEAEDQVKYGRRDVLHAILEDGLFAKPILEYQGDNSLNLEQRDPQGRTLLLAACRSSLGADAVLDSSLCDIVWNVRGGGGYSRDPFPSSSESSKQETSAILMLIAQGADPLAVDIRGQNCLHQLLGAHDSLTIADGRPPVIRRSLRHLAVTFPSLVNQADRDGTYPLHAALRRIRRYPCRGTYVDAGKLEACVADLVDLGADVCARDGRGNTVLHYLADDGLAEVWHGEETRALLYKLLDTGAADVVNIKNDAGQSAVTLLLDDGGGTAEERQQWYGHTRGQLSVVLRNSQEIDTEVLTRLDTAGVNWREMDRNGRTLLHTVARHPTEKASWRITFLLEKGVDPSIADLDGKTPRDVAIACKNSKVVELLDIYNTKTNQS